VQSEPEQAMSGQLDTTRIERNWNGLVDNAKGQRNKELVFPAQGSHRTTNIEFLKNSDKLYFNFQIYAQGCNNGRWCNGHLNLQNGFSPAHVTLVNWDNAYINYWYQVSPSGVISNFTPSNSMKGKKPDTHKLISQLPVEISHAIMSLLEDTYKGA
jgi:hypothetical protein